MTSPRPQAERLVAFSIDELRAAAEALATGRALNQAAAMTVAGVLYAVLAGRRVLPPPLPGQRSWATREALTTRDNLVRAAARWLFPDAPAAVQARELAQVMNRYATSSWPRERALDDCPPRHIGRPQEFCWRALKIWDRQLSAARIRALLAS